MLNGKILTGDIKLADDIIRDPLSDVTEEQYGLWTLCQGTIEAQPDSAWRNDIGGVMAQYVVVPAKVAVIHHILLGELVAQNG